MEPRPGLSASQCRPSPSWYIFTYVSTHRLSGLDTWLGRLLGTYRRRVPGRLGI